MFVVSAVLCIATSSRVASSRLGWRRYQCGHCNPALPSADICAGSGADTYGVGGVSLCGGSKTQVTGGIARAAGPCGAFRPRVPYAGSAKCGGCGIWVCDGLCCLFRTMQLQMLQRALRAGVCESLPHSAYNCTCAGVCVRHRVAHSYV